MKYLCERCGYEASMKCNLRTHLTRKISCKPILSDINPNALLSKLETSNPAPQKYKCKHCDIKFSSKVGLREHIKTCGDFLEKQIKQLQNQIEHLQAKQSDHDHHILVNNNTHIINNNNTTNNNVQNFNFVINRRDFGNESLDHITTDMVKCAFENTTHGAIEMVQKIHYNPDVPENNNIAFKSGKSKQMYVVKDGMWQITPSSTAIEEMVKNILKLFREHVAEHMKTDPIDACGVRAWYLEMCEANLAKPKYWKLKQELTSVIQNQTNIYNPYQHDLCRLNNNVLI